MSLYAIADLHLSFGVDKPMDIFGGWEDYQTRIYENWQKNIKEDDLVVIAGDISWAMTTEEAVADFKFIESLNGKKIIMKGNHDYWWSTKSKIEKMFLENDIKSIEIMQNNSFRYENISICGTRGWINENGKEADKKVLTREAMRLEMSIQSAEEETEKIVFLHYPPIFKNDCNYSILEVLKKYNIKTVYYGHLHGASCLNAFEGERDGITYKLISGDHIKFNPVKIY